MRNQTFKHGWHFYVRLNLVKIDFFGLKNIILGKILKMHTKLMLDLSLCTPTKRLNSKIATKPHEFFKCDDWKFQDSLVHFCTEKPICNIKYLILQIYWMRSPPSEFHTILHQILVPKRDFCGGMGTQLVEYSNLKKLAFNVFNTNRMQSRDPFFLVRHIKTRNHVSQ